MISYINADGKRDRISDAEVQAVERSGRSTWQAYIMQPGQWPEPNAAVVPLMEARPGQTEEGMYPAHVPIVELPNTKTFEQMYKGGIHWKVNNRSACDNKYRHGGMFGGPEFAMAASNARRCERCAEMYYALGREGMKWSRSDVQTLRLMWRNFDLRDECARLLGRTFESCLRKWGQIKV